MDTQITLFRQEAQLWPTEIMYGVTIDRCCAIHRPTVWGIEGAKGCKGWRHGTHRSIAVLYDENAQNFYCHAETGQLILDRRVAEEAVLMKRPGCRALGFGNVFGQKYFMGFTAVIPVYGAGYCYLLAFGSKVRSRVARILGPTPLIVDVLRLMRVVGESLVYATVQEVEPGLFHMVGANSNIRCGVGNLFRMMWDLVRLHGVNIRVGYDSVSSDSLVSGKLVTVSSGPGANESESLNRTGVWNFLVGAFRRPLDVVKDACSTSRSFIGEVQSVSSDCDDFASISGEDSEYDMATVVGDIAKGLTSGKVLCERCRFYVRPQGHADRCRPRDEVRGNSDRFFAQSQMGDALHRFDVRLFLLCSGVPKKSVGSATDMLCRRRSQAVFYEQYCGEKVPARGTSLHSLSDAFEASYYGEFRRVYRSVHLRSSGSVVLECVKPYISESLDLYE